MPIPRRTSRSRARRRRTVLVVVALATASACQSRSAEDRGREALERMQDAIPDIEARALAQPVEAGVVEEVQRQLTQLKEYHGEINGQLDSVTVNSIQAFQRSVGLRDDGILDQRTRERLKASASTQAGGAS